MKEFLCKIVRDFSIVCYAFTNQDMKGWSCEKKGLSLVTALSILSALVWLAGLAWVLQDQFFADNKNRQAKSLKPDTAQQQKQDSSGKTLQIAAIGDSLTRGTGDPDGKGYIGYLKEELAKTTKKEIELTNSAIKGQTSVQLLKQLQQPQIQRQIKMQM